MILLFALIKNLADDYSTIWSYLGVVLAAGVAGGAWLMAQEPEAVAVSAAPTYDAPPPAAAPPPSTSTADVTEPPASTPPPASPPQGP